MLLVSSFLGLFLCIYYFEFEDPIICCSEATAIHRIRSELNGRENLRWAKVRTLYSNLDTDEEIEREIVFGKTHGGWDTYIADMEIRNVKCDWVNNPTPTGGSVICSAKDNIKATFIRTGATLNSPAYWESYFD